MNGNAGNKALGWLLGAAAVLLTVIVLVSLKQIPAAFPIKREPIEAGAQVVTELLVVTLFIERGIAVLYALIFGEKERAAQKALLVGDANGMSLLAEALAAKERFRILVTFAAGLFVSIAGVRTLAGLAETVPDNDFFKPVDVIMTAGLIAGGSNALALLLQFLKDMMQNAAKEKGQPGTALATTS